MTVPEAQAILFVGEALNELFTSLSREQIAALTGTLNITQKILCLEILGTISPPTNGDHGYTPSGQKRETWAGLLKAATDRIAAGPEVS